MPPLKNHSRMKASDAGTRHEPVLLDEVLEFLKPEPGEVIVDATVGGGGHSQKILERISAKGGQPKGRLIGIDLDEANLEKAREALSRCPGTLLLVQGNFAHLSSLLKGLGVERIDGILFDLGLSSFQLDEAPRGFSFLREGPLDMRLNPRQSLRAFDLVNRSRVEELDRMLDEFGEERWHRRIALRIAEARKRAPITTTTQLAELVTRAIPLANQIRSRIHPATRTFQALRIAVNEELTNLSKGLEAAIRFLNPGARIVVISFHSLEDRIVKNTFRNYSQSRDLLLVTKKPVLPSPEERRRNPRSRSAKLRAAERSG